MTEKTSSNWALGMSRDEAGTRLPGWREGILTTAALFLSGALLGLVSKHFDSTTIIGDITTRPGIWILLVTLVSAFSPTPRSAALHTLAFLFGMLLAYYAYTTWLFGYFPAQVATAWGVFALLSPAAGYGLWFARSRGWPAMLAGAIPAGFLLSQGYPFYYTHSVLHVFDLVSAALLLLVLPAGRPERLGMLSMAIVCCWLMLILNVASRLFGGL